MCMHAASRPSELLLCVIAAGASPCKVVICCAQGLVIRLGGGRLMPVGATLSTSWPSMPLRLEVGRGSTATQRGRYKTALRCSIREGHFKCAVDFNYESLRHAFRGSQVNINKVGTLHQQTGCNHSQVLDVSCRLTLFAKACRMCSGTGSPAGPALRALGGTQACGAQLPMGSLGHRTGPSGWQTSGRRRHLWNSAARSPRCRY